MPHSLKLMETTLDRIHILDNLPISRFWSPITVYYYGQYTGK